MILVYKTTLFSLTDRTLKLPDQLIVINRDILFYFVLKTNALITFLANNYLKFHKHVQPFFFNKFMMLFHTALALAVRFPYLTE